MPGPIPRDPATVRRRNRTPGARTLEVLDGAVEVPELPADRDWHPMTVAAWADWWASPMSAEWTSSDRHGLYRLAVLNDHFWRAESPSLQRELAAEIRLQGQGFGLTPIDRRRLAWAIRRAPGGPAQPPARDRTDPRLTLVEPPKAKRSRKPR